MNSFYNLIVLTGVVLMTTSAAQGGDLSLEAVVRQVWEQSPQIRGQKDGVQIAEKDRWRRFIPNEPQLNLGNEEDNTLQTYGLQFKLEKILVAVEITEDELLDFLLQAKNFELTFEAENSLQAEAELPEEDSNVVRFVDERGIKKASDKKKKKSQDPDSDKE